MVFKKVNQPILGLDPGTKSCGVAYTYDFNAFKTFSIKFNQNISLLHKELKRLLTQLAPRLVIVGLPDKQNLQIYVRKNYIDFLRINYPQIQIVTVPEHNTTQLALTELSLYSPRATGLGSKQKKQLKHYGIIDGKSAKMILIRAHEQGLVQP